MLKWGLIRFCADRDGTLVVHTVRAQIVDDSQGVLPVSALGADTETELFALWHSRLQLTTVFSVVLGALWLPRFLLAQSFPTKSWCTRLTVLTLRWIVSLRQPQV